MQINFPHMELYQKDVLNFHIQNQHNKWIVVLSPRQVGKSKLLELLLLYASLLENGSVSMAISPIFRLSKKLFDEIKLIAGPLLKAANGTLMEITLINGSKILFASAEQGDNLRGNTIKKSGILCLDEGVWIKEDFFYDVCVPMTNVYHGNIFIFSTPKFKSGLFYNLYTQGMSDNPENTKAFNWTTYDLSKYLSQQTLDMYRKRLPKLTFRAEYLGLFITADGMVFGDFKHCFGHSCEDKSLPLYITIDWGSGSLQDDTAITIGLIQRNKIVIPAIQYFNDKKTNQTCDIILDLINDYVRKGFKEINIAVEKNSIGSIYYDVLKEKVEEYEAAHNASVKWNEEVEINIQAVVTTNKSKKDMVERLNVLFENNKIIIPDDEKLSTQLSMFEASINANGTVVYAGANDGHDDTVLSLGFMVNLLWTELVI